MPSYPCDRSQQSKKNSAPVHFRLGARVRLGARAIMPK